MYKEFETRTSYKYLKEVIGSLEEPICILGGWAVFFHANKKYQEAQGRPYLGSRDVDLGFHAKNSTAPLSQTICALEKLHFKPLSFRMVKEIHTETEEEIDNGKHIPAHFIFPMCVDLIVDTIPKDFRKTFGFNPIDEPLLTQVFEKKEFILTEEFGKKLLLPKPQILLAMKINSLPGRDKEHKRIKDLGDIFALAWYTDIELHTADVQRFVSKANMKKCLRTITRGDCGKAGLQIGHTTEEIQRVIENLLS